MSTSAVAVGKIEMQVRKGEPLPSHGWALGKDGKPTMDAKEAFFEGKGNMPLGGEELNSGYKGYGLGIFVELICGIMSGSAYAHKVRKWTNHDKPADNGHCFVAIDPECFAPGMGDRLQVREEFSQVCFSNYV
jgi:LDH2 family malate/lactate/ureidoglycolate dehydrogenase